MYSSGFVAPAHFDLVPSIMPFDMDATEVLRKFLPAFEIQHALQAYCQSKPDLCGYYKVETKSGERFFAKVKPSDRAKREVLAAEISTMLFQRGARTLPLQVVPLELPDGNQIFIYPWVDGLFFDESNAQIKNLGQALAILHNALNTRPIVGGERKKIIHIWKDQLDFISNTWFAAEYATNLSIAEQVLSQYEGCLVHNDLHRANILFTAQGDVAAFLDFEDAFATSSILVDLSAVIERFCLLPKMSTERVTLFLEHYLRFKDGEMDIQASHIAQIGLCRCFYALGILYSSPDFENPSWKSEVEKFEMLIKSWKDWEKLLLKIIP